MQLFIKLLTGRTLTVEVEENHTLAQIKDLIHAKEPSLHPSIQRLVFCGKTYPDTETIGTQGINSHTIIHLIARYEQAPPDHLDLNNADNIILWSIQYLYEGDNPFEEELIQLDATMDFSVALAAFNTRRQSAGEKRYPYLTPIVLSKKTYSSLTQSESDEKKFPGMTCYISKKKDEQGGSKPILFTPLCAGFFINANEFMIVESPNDHLRHSPRFQELRNQLYLGLESIPVILPPLNKLQDLISRTINTALDPESNESAVAFNQRLVKNVNDVFSALSQHEQPTTIAIDPGHEPLTKLLLTMYNSPENYIAVNTLPECQAARAAMIALVHSAITEAVAQRSLAIETELQWGPLGDTAALQQQQLSQIKAILEQVVTCYKENIEGTTRDTESQSFYSQSSASSSAVFKPNGQSGVKRAEDFLDRINHQDTPQKALNVILHLIDKEGGNWGENSLKTKIIEGLAGQQIGTSTTPPFNQKAPEITKGGGRNYILDVKALLNNNQPENTTNFDEPPQPQEQGWFHSLWNRNK